MDEGGCKDKKPWRGVPGYIPLWTVDVVTNSSFHRDQVNIFTITVVHRGTVVYNNTSNDSFLDS